MKPQFLLTTLTVNMALALSVHAQTPDAGTLSRQAEQGTLVQPQTLALPVPEQKAISTDTTPITVNRVVLKGNTLLTNSQLQPILTSLDGKTATFGELQLLARQVADVYHQAGYPLANVVIPPQKLADGVVTLQVIEGVIDHVSISNQSRLKDSTAQKYLAVIQTGEPLNQKHTERPLLLLKDLAGTQQVAYRLAGSEAGTELAVDLGKAPAVEGFVQVDNYGSKSTGKVRTRAGMTLNSPFGRGERLSVQGMTSLKGVNYAKASVDVPVGYDGLSTSLGVGHTRYDLGGAFKDLDATGTATTFDVGVRYPVIRSNSSNLWVNVGGEYRDLQDKVGATNTTTDKAIKSAQLGISGHHQDQVLQGGYTQWGITSTLGSLNIDSADARAIDAVSAKTQGTYYKVTGNLGRTQYITPKFSLTANLSGQWANKNLDSAEQLSLGGADAVAAYHANDVSADIGVIGQIEARYAAASGVSASVFYDAGRAKLRAKPYLTQDNFVNLHGGGFALSGQYKNVSLQTKLAWHHDDKKFSQDKNPRAWVKVGYQF